MYDIWVSAIKSADKSLKVIVVIPTSVLTLLRGGSWVGLQESCMSKNPQMREDGDKLEKG